MIGTKLQRAADGSKWIVTGQVGGGYVIQRADGVFDSPQEISTAALAAEFGVAAAEPSQVDEVAAWRQLGAAFHEAVRRSRRRAPRDLTPEVQLTDDQDAARGIARAIFEDADTLAEVEAGLRQIHPAVARELDALIEERDATAATPPKRRR